MTIPEQINYSETDEFRKDLKKLLKKFRSLNEDIEAVKANLIDIFYLKEINSNGIFEIPGYCSDNIRICKIKKFACKSLKGFGVASGIRIIYAFYVHTYHVEFIEIYYKGTKTNEDKDRIIAYLKTPH